MGIQAACCTSSCARRLNSWFRLEPLLRACGCVKFRRGRGSGSAFGGCAKLMVAKGEIDRLHMAKGYAQDIKALTKKAMEQEREWCEAFEQWAAEPERSPTQPGRSHTPPLASEVQV